MLFVAPLLVLPPEFDMLGTVDLLEEPPLKPDELPLLDVLGDVLLLVLPLDLEPVEKEPDRDDVLGELPFASATVRFAVLASNKMAVIMAINLVFILFTTLSLILFNPYIYYYDDTNR